MESLRTITSPLVQAEDSGSRLLALTILWHPDARRIGARAVLTEIGTPALLNRFSPSFAPPSAGLGDAEAFPLGTAGISRTPIHIVACADGSAVVVPSESRMSIELGGIPLRGPATLEPQTLDAGVVLLLGGQVALCLHRLDTLPDGAADEGLIGAGSSMVRLRRVVRMAAASDLPVLILGETGTGKELVANAIHRTGTRAQGPLLAVNMATLGESLAAAELFGAVRGAYTGAQSSRQGLFGQAHRGTLFLDEIGDTPAAVQPMLLRALETGEFRPVGSQRVERSDARLVAATDHDLSCQAFSQPLLRRLEGLVVCTPPLRRRREDIGVLARHLLGATLADPDAAANVPWPLVRAICLHDWPGNVRQLGNAMQRLALGARFSVWPTVEELLGAALPPMEAAVQVSTSPQEVAQQQAPAIMPLPAPSERARFRAPSTVTPAMLETALNESGWCLRQAAALLGVSRPSLYNLVEQHAVLRPADTLAAADIEAALQPPPVDLAALAARLKTPREALRRHMRKLCIAWPA